MRGISRAKMSAVFSPAVTTRAQRKPFSARSSSGATPHLRAKPEDCGVKRPSASLSRRSGGPFTSSWRSGERSAKPVARTAKRRSVPYRFHSQSAPAIETRSSVSRRRRSSCSSAGPTKRAGMGSVPISSKKSLAMKAAFYRFLP